MPIPTNRNEFTAWAIRRVTGGANKINISPEAVDDCISNAIYMVQRYANSGHHLAFMALKLSEMDINNGFVEMPELCVGVTKMFAINGDSTVGGIGSSGASVAVDGVSLPGLGWIGSATTSGWGRIWPGLPSGSQNPQTGPSAILQMQQNLANMQAINPNRSRPIIWSISENKIYLQVHQQKLMIGQYILIEGYLAVDPYTHQRFWDSDILKRLAVAYLKRDMGNVLSKFEGVKLSGDVVVGGKAMLDAAEAEIKELETGLTITGRYGGLPSLRIG